jgi:hypothetical protein
VNPDAVHIRPIRLQEQLVSLKTHDIAAARLRSGR